MYLSIKLPPTLSAERLIKLAQTGPQPHPEDSDSGPKSGWFTTDHTLPSAVKLTMPPLPCSDRDYAEEVVPLQSTM